VGVAARAHFTKLEDEGDNAPADIRPLCGALSNSMFRDGRQHDAGEALTALLSDCEGEGADLTPVQFTRRRRFHCRCGGADQGPDELLRGLLIPMHNPHGMEVAIRELMNGEEDVLRTCPHCPSLTARARHSVPHGPRTLVVTVQRAMMDGAKNRRHLRPPSRLHLETAGVYRIRAVVTHHGTTALNGHYTCTTISGGGTGGRLYDDAEVRTGLDTEEGLDEVARDAYLIVYEREVDHHA